jgi:hypothetical protein
VLARHRCLVVDTIALNVLWLATIEAPVQGEKGKVFSTAPEVALAPDGKTYYVKGRNGAVAFSEVAGCSLAALTGLRVPPAFVCTLGGDLYAGVESVPKPQRSIRPWLLDGRINNPVDLYSVIAVDTWLANDDRNMGNLVGSSTGDGRVDVFMIDFEKSRTLLPNPFMSSGSVEPKKLWPTNELGAILKANPPPQCPGNILERIKQLSEHNISAIVRAIAAELPFVDWWESSIEILFRRAQNISKLVEVVWQTV